MPAKSGNYCNRASKIWLPCGFCWPCSPRSLLSSVPFFSRHLLFKDMLQGWRPDSGVDLIPAFCATLPYRDTSLTRKRPPPEPYRRPMHRLLGGSLRGWTFSYGRGTSVCNPTRLHTVAPYRGTSPLRKRPPPKDPPRTIGIGLL